MSLTIRLDLSWMRDAVAVCYCTENGRPGIDSEAVARRILAGFLLGIVCDRRLMREAQANLTIRWLAGYRLDEGLLGHSSLTRIRRRSGGGGPHSGDLRTCRAVLRGHRLAQGDAAHVDVTLIRRTAAGESAPALVRIRTDPAGDACKVVLPWPRGS